jgi:hypothetical protein
MAPITPGSPPTPALATAGSGGEAGRVSDESGDEVLATPRVRVRRWQYFAAGLVAVVAASVQVVVRDGLADVVRGTGHAAVHAAPAARVISGQELLSSVVGNRCPSAVVCGLGSTVSPGMAAEFRADFPGASLTMQARAFDAGAPRTFWQQISATTPAGTSVVLTEQRIPVAVRHPSALTVRPTPDGAMVRQKRGAWLVTANLIGTGSSAIPIAAARKWVAEARLPR